MSEEIKTLDTKLERILADPSCNDFILADAKDADMAFGMASPGADSPETNSLKANSLKDRAAVRFKTLGQYRQQIRQNVEQGLLDIMLMSASTSEVLTINEKLFTSSAITPAVRMNDTTDIWSAAGANYRNHPALPFRSALIDHATCGKLDTTSDQDHCGVDLGLYSITFNNCADYDSEMLNAYREFRIEAELSGFRHFLEVFDPNCLQAPVDDMGRFMNDNIARTLAGVVESGRPLFLKIAYHGPEAMEQLVEYDRSLVVGILGGASGTTLDAFHQLWEAKKYGARVALYGRMINNSEHQLTFIQHLRWIADGEIQDPAEAVKSYHGELQKLDIAPYRPLDDDLKR